MDTSKGLSLFYNDFTLFQHHQILLLMFEIAASNLKMVREKGDPENNPLPTKLKPGDTVLVQNHTKGPFDPKYVGNY